MLLLLRGLLLLLPRRGRIVLTRGTRRSLATAAVAARPLTSPERTILKRGSGFKPFECFSTQIFLGFRAEVPAPLDEMRVEEPDRQFRINRVVPAEACELPNSPHVEQAVADGLAFFRSPVNVVGPPDC